MSNAEHPESASRPESLGLHLYRCPGCGGSFGRGKGVHGLARHECPPGQLAAALARVAELEEQLAESRKVLGQPLDAGGICTRPRGPEQDCPSNCTSLFGVRCSFHVGAETAGGGEAFEAARRAK